MLLLLVVVLLKFSIDVLSSENVFKYYKATDLCPFIDKPEIVQKFE